MKNMQKLDVTKLKEFENHPYKVKHDDEMELLIDSIKEHGILSPIKNGSNEQTRTQDRFNFGTTCPELR